MVPEDGSSLFKDFEIIDYCFTALFTVDLLLNLVANWFWPFWADYWSVSSPSSPVTCNSDVSPELLQCEFPRIDLGARLG